MDPNALAGQISQLDSSYNPTAIYNQATTELGIPDARARVQALQTHLVNTQNAINAVDPNVTARTSGNLVTDAQRSRIVNVERQPLQQDYTTQNQAYGTESTNLNNLEGQLNTRVSNETANYNAKRQGLATQLDTALKQQAAAEATRQFNITSAQNATKIANSGSGGGNSQATAASQQRKDKGFNFQDTNGKAISARLYAQLTNTDFNTLLKAMAAKGDAGATDVLKNGARSAAYKALTWD